MYDLTRLASVAPDALLGSMPPPARPIRFSLNETPEHDRAARADRLLTDPRRVGAKISSIALDAGFADLSYFNRAFRQACGDTPSGVRAGRALS